MKIGFQTRIDLWNEETLDLLGRARCISMECGIESITEAGRDELNKNCRIGTDRISELLIYAKQRIPWVQANLILTDHDNKDEIRRWQEHLKATRRLGERAGADVSVSRDAPVRAVVRATG